MTTYLLIFAFMLVNAVFAAVGVAVGFAVVIPVFNTVMPLQQAITFALVYIFMGYVAIFLAFRSHIRWDLVKSLLPASLVGAVLGGLFTAKLSELLLLFVILGFVLYYLMQKLRNLKGFAQEVEVHKRKVRVSTILVGIVAGFLQGGGLGGGDVRRNYLYAKNLRIQEERGTTAIVGASILLMSIVTRVAAGSFTLPGLWVIIPLVPIVIIAAYLGRHITHKLNVKAQNIVIVGLMVVSVGLLTYQIVQIITGS